MKTKKHTLDEILSDPDKLAGETYGVNGILATLFRRILKEKKVSHVRWGQCMHKFLNDPANRIPATRRDQTSMRGNIAKELLNDQMTLKVFCKGLVFLQLFRVRFVIEIDDRMGNTTVVKIPVTFPRGALNDESDGEEQDNERPTEETTQSIPQDGSGRKGESTNEH